MAIFTIIGLILAVTALAMTTTTFLVNRHRRLKLAAWLEWQEAGKDPLEFRN